VDYLHYTDVVVEAVVILLDQDAIPLVTTEDQNEILLEPTWNSTEGKAARKRKRKDGKTAVEKAEEEAQRVAKIAEHNRKCAEKEAEKEAQRVAKIAKRDAKWSVEDDATIEKMIDGGSSYDKIASKLGNDRTKMDIYYRWTGYLMELSGIIKPPVQPGIPSRITWTADVDAAIARMRTDDISFAKIESKLGNGLKENDIKNRWNRHLKDKLQ
jgi:hypothetical protein